MGVITITIAHKRAGSARTRDKGPDLATMYAGLYDRLHKALIEASKSTHDDYDPSKHPHAPAGQANGGQFTATPGGGGPVGEKPTKVVAKLTKAALHELLSTGHPFSKKELMDIMGPEHKEVTINTWLSKFKSAKHAGDYGALDIKKLPNGSFQVVMPNGQPAPPAPADMPSLIDDLKEPTTKSKEGDFGKYTEVTMPNGDVHKLQKLNATESMGLPGWHDLDAPNGSSWLGDTKEQAIKELQKGKPIGLPKAEPMVMKHNSEPYVPKVTVPFQPVSKDKADKSYEHALSMAQDNMLEAIQDHGVHSEKAVLAYKKSKALAMAQWATNTTGTLHEPKYDDKVYEADKILANAMTGVDEFGEGAEEAIAQWKKNTQLEKQGKLGAKPAPKPDTKTLASATKHWLDATKDEPAPKPVGYDVILPPKFKHVSVADIEASGSKSFGNGMEALKSELSAMGSYDPIENKKLVEKSLQEHLKDKKHFQALKAAYAAGSPSETSLERRLVASWAGSSGDGNPLSCALQMATQDAFQQPKDAVTHQSLETVLSAGGHNDKLTQMAAQKVGLTIKTAEECRGFRMGLQEFIRGQYENTQALFKKMGRDHVFLARGMEVVPGAEAFSHEPANVKLQPASSFSTNYGTAKTFAGSSGTVYLVKVPVSQVLGTYLTGFGCSNEHELVVLGHDTIKSFPLPSKSASNLSQAIEQVKSQIQKGKA
jgi:hypothetical protein